MTISYVTVHPLSRNTDFLHTINICYYKQVKLLMIGDSGVGKSCLLLRFSDDSFSTNFITTIGIDFKLKTVEIDGKRVKLQIWDTAGQERFRTITTAYYRGAMGVLLVYDISDEQSFLNIRNWMRNIEQHATENVKKILIGNKCDCHDERVISTNRGQDLANEYGIKFFETSAKSDINVYESFVTLAKDIVIAQLQATQAKDQGGVDIGGKKRKPSGDGGCACEIL